jgi:hypothetical protein
MIAGPLWSQVPFATTPSWISTNVSDYSTGAAWSDINNDGWLDLVIANGNDMARQQVVVYHNSGTGTLPTTPGWQSGDVDYHGHLSIGDVNNDGYPDVAVSVYIGAAGFSQKGKVKLYMNSGGTLSSLPAWVSKDTMYTFSCAFGDPDNDGDLDLAVAGGESYNNRPERNRVYFNNGGTLDSLPGWMSGQASYSYDVGWFDCDNDGDLDLVFANEDSPNRMYENFGDSLGTVPAWSSTDPGQYANSLFVGDVNNDGFADLAVSDNSQLGGTGKFKIYLNNSGTLNTTPFWSSTWSGYGSGITLADFDDDGDKDLVTGGWWQPCRIYVNQGGTFTGTPQWTSGTGSVVEAIVFGDVDNDRIDTTKVKHISDGSSRLIRLPRAPAHRLRYVLFGGDTVSRGHYCFDLENGWVSLDSLPPAGDTISIGVDISRDIDFAVSNWDPTIGNYLFTNTLPPVFIAGESSVPSEIALLQNYPNPFNVTTVMSYELRVKSDVRLKVYDLLGREVATLAKEIQDAGFKSVTWDAGNLPSGLYVAQLTTGGRMYSTKMVLCK